MSKYGSRTFMSALAGASIGLGLIAACPFALAVDESRETVVPVFSYPIAGVAGKSLTALTVSYAPGAKTPAHRHGRAFVVGYVLEGAIRSRLGNGETKVYRVGESWSEDPGAHHTVSENASTTEPAKILALFVATTDARDLVTIDGQAAAETKK